MTARGVRSVWIVAFAVLLLGGGLVACLGAGLFGTHRASEAILSAHVLVHWWREGHWLLLLATDLLYLSRIYHIDLCFWLYTCLLLQHLILLYL